MGKSSFIDLLCSLTFEQVRALAPVEASDAFCRSISESQRVVVDYNGNQSTRDMDGKYPNRGLACRALHRYVFLKGTRSICILYPHHPRVIGILVSVFFFVQVFLP